MSAISDPADGLLRAGVIMAAAAAISLEILSTFDGVSRAALTMVWLVLAAAVAWRVRIRLRLPDWSRWEWAAALAITAILAITLLIALVSAPNSADGMAYHLPRVVYWAQQRSVGFFPTTYFNQLTQPPLTEYLILHSYVLSGGDRFANLVQWSGFVLSIVGVALVSRELGAGRAGQWLAAILVATLPNAILQSTGVKQECLLSAWLLGLMYFGLRRDAVFLGLCAGLALFTKATAFLFLPPLLVAVAWRARGKAAWVAMAVLVLNGPLWLRNLQLTGSPLGYESAVEDDRYRWRNEQVGFGAAASNILRHVSEQMGGRSEQWNQKVYEQVVRLHRAFGLDANDPATTWPDERYRPPRNVNHEANAANPWHLLLILVAIPTSRKTSLLLASLFAGFLLFAAYLKWQPYMQRLLLPLFVLAMPAVAIMLDRTRRRWLQVAIALFLCNAARPYLFENWTRRLQGQGNILETPRDEQYFHDMAQWDNRESYRQAAAILANAGCREIGIDIRYLTLEYPLIEALRRHIPGVRFQHAGVDNATVRYRKESHEPCAVACLDCAKHPHAAARYASMHAKTAGDFLIFLSR